MGTKKKSRECKARKMAAIRKQETPEQRAARLESMRNYARSCRENETESQREERLKSMRDYTRKVRERKEIEMRRQRLAMIIESCKEHNNVDTPQEIEAIYLVKVEMK